MVRHTNPHAEATIFVIMTRPTVTRRANWLAFSLNADYTLTPMNNAHSDTPHGTLIDSILLLDATMLWCRHGGVEAAKYLQELMDVFLRVQTQGHLLVDMPADWVASADVPMNEAIVRETPNDRNEVAMLPPDKRYLLAIFEYATAEMLELCKTGRGETIRSLGYALHPLCALVRTDEPVHPRLFQFNFRIAARHWAELSVDLRQSLCDLAGYEFDEAEQLVTQEGFAIDMWRDQ